MNPVPVNGIFTVFFKNKYVFTYNLNTSTYKITTPKGEVISKKEHITELKVAQFFQIIEESEKTAIAHEKLIPDTKTAVCIGNAGGGWIVLCEGDFAFCKAHEKRVAYAYNKIKTIYKFNLSDYGIK